MTSLIATYVHHFDPFAIQFTESFGIRWYGLAYVAGFLAAFLLLRWFVKLGISELKEDQVADFITVTAVGGVMIGGRLGYMLLYQFNDFIARPTIFFDFLGGGMASHGAFAGLVLSVWGYAIYTKKSFLGLGDNLVTVAPVGLFFGRIANFVNGELYGRPTESSLGMKFPDELSEVVKTDQGAAWKYSLDELRALAARAVDVAPDLSDRVESAISSAMASGFSANGAAISTLIEASRENAEFRVMLGEILTLRHPSQLYEALIEGLLLFLVLLAIRLKWRDLYHGVLSGLFFIVYGIGRISVECFREPDAAHIAGMTRGQFYSLFMIALGTGFLIYAAIAKRRTILPQR